MHDWQELMQCLALTHASGGKRRSRTEQSMAAFAPTDEIPNEIGHQPEAFWARARTQFHTRKRLKQTTTNAIEIKRKTQ